MTTNGDDTHSFQMEDEDNHHQINDDHDDNNTSDANTDTDTNTDTNINMPLIAQQLNFEKFMNMQDKRVVVTIRYSGDSGLEPYYLTVGKKIRSSHPDVLIEKRILPASLDHHMMQNSGSGNSERGNKNNRPTFEILVDGKVVVGKSATMPQRLVTQSEDTTGGISVFVSMEEMDMSISKARRKRRPTNNNHNNNNLYGQGTEESAMRLRMLTKGTPPKNDAKK